MSPYTPYLSEMVYQELKRILNNGSELPISIHLLDWPKADLENQYNSEILQKGNILQLIAFLGRSARQKAKIKIRQPLKKLMVFAPSQYKQIIEEGKQILLEELNVKELEFLDDSSNIFYYNIKPNLPVLGKRLGNKVRYIQQYLKENDPNLLVKQLEQGSIEIPIENQVYQFDKEDFLIEGISKEGTQGQNPKVLLLQSIQKLPMNSTKRGLYVI
jgi:Isoleucyl-tRNA synthetase